MSTENAGTIREHGVTQGKRDKKSARAHGRAPKRNGKKIGISIIISELDQRLAVSLKGTRVKWAATDKANRKSDAATQNRRANGGIISEDGVPKSPICNLMEGCGVNAGGLIIGRERHRSEHWKMGFREMDDESKSVKEGTKA
jgi:hypothetical protein